METTFTDIDCPDCYGKGRITTGFNQGDCRRCQSTGKLPEHDTQLLLERIKNLEQWLTKLSDEIHHYD